MIFKAQDTRRITEIMREAAAREILPRFRNLASGAIREKTSALDVVTDADEAAERHITDALHKAFPGCFVLGEEAAEKDHSLFDRLGDADLAFVVDPVDGTKNFASGLPLFAVMIAAIVKGEVAAGFILDPIADDISIGVRGEGARNENAAGKHEDLRVMAPEPLASMSGGASWASLKEPLRSTLARNLVKPAAVFSYRCGGHEYRLAASGQCHFLVFVKLMPWDHAPGWLIHREAGGYSARFDGRPYLPTERSGGLICAPDQASYEMLRAELLDSPAAF
ncbi:inositol monophosphatase family protein [Methylovirgula sp. 4M-Z18]|uniref:inositol monophosphatase family protein n=1 Tax=Methylovirgula sp. 4M-Z18 TaxID=2293567 RepID=UPI000E2F5B27|nr:inositol monophosphatase family protein [Methylovirgula sp. 4M-Z18]RFB80621.1 inositol monophosphatase [Methylovirgula sp. 4M-Z18]